MIFEAHSQKSSCKCDQLVINFEPCVEKKFDFWNAWASTGQFFAIDIRKNSSVIQTGIAVTIRL